ncbi:MAG: hypothetical protein A4E63_02966 [Syntrophorhabdus sp. PtaU1.Bin050]|nr:MAG: hypothetical protein A4E63_02966 [Syntrophorhabdus sp. PtaU1.Bin050]
MDRIDNIHRLTRRLIIMTVVSILFVAVFFGISYRFNQRLMMTWVGFVCGIIGGFVSIQQRIKSVSDQELELLTKSWFQILLIPIFGGIFSLVLYCVFLAGILSGDLFPKFYMPKPPEGGPSAQYMIELFTNTYPNAGQDLAKFLFWSFVAGFSERFVPQVISNVTSNVAGHKDPSDR